MVKNVELDDVSYSEFVRFTEDKFIYYKRIGLLMKPDNGELGEITTWKYGKVKELQMMFTEEVTLKRIPQILAFAHDKTLEEMWDERWHQVFRYYNHILAEVQTIVEREKILSYEPDADQEEAGIGMFAQFGTLNAIDMLAEGNVLLWDSIEEKPYYLIFAKLHMESVKATYNKNLMRIHSRKKP